MSDFKSRQTECTRVDAVIIFAVLATVVATVAMGIYGLTKLLSVLMGCF